MLKTENKVQLVGYIAHDPVTKKLPTGAVICRFVLITYSFYETNTKETIKRSENHNCVAWGKIAEQINIRVEKGHNVLVQGLIQYRSHYEDDTQQVAEIKVSNFRDFDFDENNGIVNEQLVSNSKTQ